MPIYEYICEECGHGFEALVRANEKPACPACGRKKLARQLSVPAAHVASSSPVCPAREMGACGSQGCGSNCQFNP